MKITFICLFSIILAACGDSSLPEPNCRVNSQTFISHQGAAACVVVLSGKLLVSQVAPNVYNLAVAEPNPARSAQCAAHHELWLQTGFNAEVGKVIGIHADGTWLFTCKVDAGFDGTEAPFDAPLWSPSKVKKLAFIDPFKIEESNWEVASQFTVTRDAFVIQNNANNLL